MPSERLLFVELWRLGDAVAATAGLAALRSAEPTAEIALLAHPQHGDPLFRSPAANVRIAYDAFWTRGKLPRDKYLPWTIDYAALTRCAAAVRRFRPDHIFLFRGDPREQLFFRSFLGATISDLRGPHPFVPGVRSFRRPAGVPRFKEYVAHIEQWSGVAGAAEPHIAGVSRSIPSGGYALVHPGASWRYKQWSAAKVARLVEWARSSGLPVRIVAGPAERPFVEELRRQLGPTPVEYPSLPEFYALVADAAVVICNNSAALHIAEAVGTPCIALTGSSDPVRWGTFREHSRTIAKSVHLPCHPCGEKRCVRPAHPCIEEIEQLDVVDALLRMHLVPGYAAEAAAGRG
ncbi:MAG TPA: glycosyltransferase family 9 protein [Gemmatimonadaceae bacterium]|nr:glycosyltransferase family 9 protein [Gemmatimonadaceae bacterium]